MINCLIRSHKNKWLIELRLIKHNSSFTLINATFFILTKVSKINSSVILQRKVFDFTSGLNSS